MPPAATPARQYATFLARYTPEVQAMAKEARARLRAQLPGAVELVYDNYNFLVLGYSPSGRPSEAVLSLAMAPRWVTLFFLHGKKLPDPHRVLEGAANQVRSVRLLPVERLDEPAVRALVAAAVVQGGDEWPTRFTTVIQSVSAKQRPRRPAAATNHKPGNDV